MRTAFRTLLTLSVSHAFYAERCRDFGFVFPADTARVLRNGRLLSRERDGVLHLLYEAGDDDEALVPIADATLRIGLLLINPHFANFTALPAGFPSSKLHYRNSPDPDALVAADPIAIVGPVFAHEVSAPDRPVTVTVQDASGAELGAETLPDGDQRSSVSFDLRGIPAGSILVTESFPEGETVESTLYLDEELSRLDVAGLVEITVGEGFYDSSPAPVVPAFEIAFEAREEMLSYYVVASNYSTTELNQLSVSDVGFDEDGREEVEFVTIAPGDFTSAELSPSLLAQGDEDVLLFRSETPQARRERARRRIQLSRNGDVLIANLPQPGADRAKAEMIIHLSKP